ncbi:MAG: 50S ribosomal protein L6 [Bacillota bacterium]
MSRVGRKPITIPEGVTVTIDGNRVAVKGPKAELVREFHGDITVAQEDNALVVTRPSDTPEHRALHGLVRALLANMVEGVTKGYQRGLTIEGAGYRATKQGNKLVLNVGYSHPVEITPPAGVEIEVPAPTQIVVKGADKEAVGQLAAVIRDVRPPIVYLGKGIRYSDERVRRKAGKTGK